MSLFALIRRLACHHDKAQHLYNVSEHPKGLLGAMYSIPALNDCELTKMNDEGFMLSGHESAQHLQDIGPRQTRWCRPVPEEDAGAAGSVAR